MVVKTNNPAVLGIQPSGKVPLGGNRQGFTEKDGLGGVFPVHALRSPVPAIQTRKNCEERSAAASFRNTASWPKVRRWRTIMKRRWIGFTRLQLPQNGFRGGFQSFCNDFASPLKRSSNSCKCHFWLGLAWISRAFLLGFGRFFSHCTDLTG